MKKANVEEENLPKTRDLVRHAFSDMKEYSKTAASLPLDDYEYHEAFPGFRKRVRDHSEVLLQLMDSCCGLLPKRRRVSILEDNVAPHVVPTLNETQRTVVMEAIDSFLENVDSLLDEVRGNKMSANDQLAVHFGGELTLESGNGGNGSSGASQRASRAVMRPQLTFSTPVDNSDKPFVPVYDDAEGRTHTGEPSTHPFAEAIKNFVMPEEQMVHKTDTPYVPLDTCPLKFVDTVEGLKDTVDKLLTETEIAVDLEHHDFYSYLGFTCLMQISTRTEDIIVDCLKLRSSMHLLSRVFLHPHILKVFHGAREDVRWLQKDFGLYLINFFDTGLALQALHMPYSLAFAVDHFCQVKLDKKYQTADWRVRPIPAVMVHYARQDTHYLLYIYDRLKALLLNSEARASVGNLLRHVYQESRQLSLELYEKPRLDPEESYKAALYRSLGGLSHLQEMVAREVFNWRDAVAREVDDSPAAVLQLSGVLAIACNLPTTVKDVLQCCNPVSGTMRKEAGKVVALVAAAMQEAGEEQVANIAGDADEEDAKAGDDGNTTAAGRRATLQRSVGVHRPMTGTLPSLESSVGLPLWTSAPQAPRWRDATPSTWFQAMRQLSVRLAARPIHQVALQGQDLMSTMEYYREKKAEAGVSPGQQEEKSEKEVHHRPVEDVHAPNAPAAVVETPEEAEPADHSTLGTAGNVETKKSAQKEEPIALRQKYGTGDKNRKAAQTKKKAAKKKK